MINNLIISFIVLYGGRSVLEGGYQAFYDVSAGYIADHAFTLFTYGVAGAIALIVLSFIFGGLGWYAIMYVLSKGVFLLSQLAISLISVAAVMFWFEFKQNLWWDVGYFVGSIPFLVLFASGYCLKQFDFNYPVSGPYESSIALPILSGLIIFVSAYFAG